ncbi:HAD family hydrolase [Streptomyces sp. AC627_RSS907]|uniref:HAD family hydrolase n=1 Tax=Streptomyces sp. AC627_RSS907 TaxID=2823684 RepID=UPI0027E47DAC|nr:HAD family hydrolase [Streptomyces sp. AC627_RSS907]
MTTVTAATAEPERVADELGRTVGDVRLVLWDFDGPICRLFARHRASAVADVLVGWLADRGMAHLLSADERAAGDPQAVLRAVGRRRPGSGLVTELEERYTAEELRAVTTATPTAYTEPLIRAWSAAGVRPAVVTNNSPRAASAYLSRRDLLPCFGPHVYGRDDRPHHLKPSPHLLHRAMDGTGTAASAALMIGDSPDDLGAARSAGVAFLGYARDERKLRLLREAGARLVIGSFAPLLLTVGRHGARGGPATVGSPHE